MPRASAGGYFERNAVKYAEWTRESRGFDERRAVFGELIGRCRPAPGEFALCLDLGCGNAALGSLAAAQGFEVIAIDGSAQMLELARRAHARPGDAQICDFRQANLPLDEGMLEELRGRADLIIASSVVEYLDNCDAHTLFAQCAQLLKPTGVTLISFPNRRALYWRAQRLLGDRGPLRGNIAAVQQRQWIPEQVRDVAIVHGLHPDRFEYFALPFQELLDPIPLGRPTWLATLFLAALTPVR